MVLAVLLLANLQGCEVNGSGPCVNVFIPSLTWSPPPCLKMFLYSLYPWGLGRDGGNLFYYCLILERLAPLELFHLRAAWNKRDEGKCFTFAAIIYRLVKLCWCCSLLKFIFVFMPQNHLAVCRPWNGYLFSAPLANPFNIWEHSIFCGSCKKLVTSICSPTS